MEYSNPTREEDPYALPDIEVWHASEYPPEDGEALEEGWYWWACLPGCLPDSDPAGPFAAYDESLADAQDM